MRACQLVSLLPFLTPKLNGWNHILRMQILYCFASQAIHWLPIQYEMNANILPQPTCLKGSCLCPASWFHLLQPWALFSLAFLLLMEYTKVFPTPDHLQVLFPSLLHDFHTCKYIPAWMKWHLLRESFPNHPKICTLHLFTCHYIIIHLFIFSSISPSSRWWAPGGQRLCLYHCPTRI